jgi:hypothetical protein
MPGMKTDIAPQTVCAACGKPVPPGKPIVARKRTDGDGSGGALWRLLCVSCDRKRDHWNDDSYTELDRRPCPTCGRPMYFRDRADRPVPCSRQCAYRAKIAQQLASRKVGPHTNVCESCGEVFTSKRADALTCSNACRQRLFCQRR